LVCLAVFPPAAIPFALALLFVLNFFRDPERRPEGGGGALIAPADGKVVEVTEVEETEHVRGRALKIAIFMNVFDVHVNRAPCDARVEWVRHEPGRFLNAIRSTAGFENERTLLALRDAADRPVLVKQIAGLIARRIVCSVRSGDRVERGKRFGMIQFGSRVEVFLPADKAFSARVRLGDRTRAGRTVLGEWR